MKRDAVGAFSPQMIAAIDPRSAAGLTTDKIAALDTGQTATLEPEQLAAFSYYQVNAIVVDQFAQLFGPTNRRFYSDGGDKRQNTCCPAPAHDCGHQD